MREETEGAQNKEKGKRERERGGDSTVSHTGTGGWVFNTLHKGTKWVEPHSTSRDKIPQYR